ncbi:MAG: single-stranded-DNA-specific exonuclease RecJ [Bdellovibrio sp.]|nr:MAG: single-stranded-DNA-specific exonuclease RecJ [Bdellovibrio sp.]
MPLPLWKVFQKRGLFSREDLEEFFKPSLKNLTPPEKILGIDKAVFRTIKAYKNHEKIVVYGDYDLDGTPGVALLVSALKDMGFSQIQSYQPSRLQEGYGLHKKAVRAFRQEGVQLIITVDVGITDVEAVKEANHLGVDVIITDHHQPKEQLPEAYAIVNPNQRGCASGLCHLSGTGVAFYFVMALKQQMKKEGLLEREINLKQYLDLFTLATISDLVPLVKENRVLLKHGLLELQRTTRPGLKALLESLELVDQKLLAEHVGYKIAPRLNALSRLEEGVLPLDLLTVTSEPAARELVHKVHDIHKRRKALQKEAFKEALELWEASQQETFCWVWSKNFHQGVISLVATQLAQHLGIPTFVGALLSNGQIVGSARKPDSVKMNLLEVLEQAPLLKFGGHPQAAGFELSQDQVTLFDEHLRAQSFSYENCEKCWNYDAEMSLEEVTPEFLKWLDACEPFGVGFEKPVFYFPAVEVLGLKELSGEHLRLSLGEGFGRVRKTAVWFSPKAQKREELQVGDIVDVLGVPQWNIFQGTKSLQILVYDLCLSEEKKRF